MGVVRDAECAPKVSSPAGGARVCVLRPPKNNEHYISHAQPRVPGNPSTRRTLASQPPALTPTLACTPVSTLALPPPGPNRRQTLRKQTHHARGLTPAGPGVRLRRPAAPGGLGPASALHAERPASLPCWDRSMLQQPQGPVAGAKRTQGPASRRLRAAAQPQHGRTPPCCQDFYLSGMEHAPQTNTEALVFALSGRGRRRAQHM